MDLHKIFENLPYGQDKRISKKSLPSLTDCFKEISIWMGLPRLGMHGQYRCSCMNLHAYDFGDYWEIHKDKHNPFTKPMEHLVEDAPNVLAVIAGAVIIGAGGIAYFLSRPPKDNEKSSISKQQDE
ncbi:MAG: hypothetical protein ACFFD6_01850 [Candidatus Thorarchaeota archaeon]